jgi:hypothetical protein
LKKLTFILALTGALLMAGCSLFAPEEFTMDPPAVDSGTADFSVYVSIGNSLTAGYQSGALYESTQQYGYAMQLANAMSVASFEVPWIADPGIYDAELELGHLQVVLDAEGNASLAPIPWEGISSPLELLLNAELQGPYNNMGIPGSTAYDLLFAMDQTTCFTAQIGEPNAYFDMILRNGSIPWTAFGGAADDLPAVEIAKLAQPTFASVWIGNNELLLPATSGIGAPFYPAEDDGGPLNFRELYTGILGGLVTDLPRAKFVTADLPYVTNIPYFTTVLWFVIDSDSNPVDGDPETDGIQFVGLLAEEGAGFQLASGDLVCLAVLSYDSDSNGVPDLNEGMGIPDAILIAGIMADLEVDYATAEGILNHPTESPFPHHGTLIPGGLTLVAAEVANILQATDDYNTVIHSVAGGHGVPVVEINAYFQDVAANGAEYNGEEYSTTFVTGGLFSLDGVHPSNVGYALIAEEFIETINDAYGSELSAALLPTVPPVTRSISEINGLPTLPARFPGMPF